MGHRNLQLRGHQRPCERTIRIAVDEHPIRALILNDRFQAAHHFTGLGAVAGASDIQIVAWLGVLDSSKNTSDMERS